MIVIRHLNSALLYISLIGNQISVHIYIRLSLSIDVSFNLAKSAQADDSNAFLCCANDSSTSSFSF